MKSICYIGMLVCMLMFSQEFFAQSRTRPRQQETQSSELLPELSVRAKSMNENQTQNIKDVPWIKEVYRQLNLKEEPNTPLYYPVEPVGDRMNLFTLIFKLLSENKIVAYEYLDGREIFTDQYKVNFKVLLDRFRIIYTEQRSGANTRYVIEESDIPSGEILAYLVKEAWYFDQANSTYNVKILAICPYLIREGDFGEVNRQPMFWLPYENIRPYIMQKPIMTSNYNNAMVYTMDDYFRKRMFKGEIVKTTNLLNYPLAQLFKDNPEALKHAQDSIENQLKSFEKKLWIEPDTAKVASKDNNKDKKSVTKTSSSRSSSSGQTRAKEAKPQKAKSQSSSTPTKSVRRTR